MNYYEHHIGDYDEATSHLTACEDGIYSRLMRKYYATEAPLIADVAKLQRLIRAKSKEEKQAVVDVLEEFFHLEEDGWHQDTCDEVIAAFLDGEPEREAKRENDRERQRRARERRRALFEALRSHGIVPAWDTRTGELEAQLSRVTQREESRPVTPPVTRDNTATQSPLPIPNTQTPEEDSHTQPPVEAGVRGLCGKALKRAGINPMQFSLDDPRFVALVEQGATPEEFEAIGREAVAKAIKVPFPWVLTVLQSRRAEAAAITLAPIAKPQSAITTPSRAADETQEYLREQFKPLTPEQKARADEARKRAMQAVTPLRG